MPISLEQIEIFKKFKISQVGVVVDYICAKSLRADLRNEEIRELRIKGIVLTLKKKHFTQGANDF